MSEGDATGKTPGTDLREGVDTMPTLLLKEQAEAGTLDDLGCEILDLLANSDLAVDENLAEVVNMLRRHSVLDQTQELAKEWMDKGLQSLKDVPEGPVRDSLVQYAEYSINRSA